MKAAQWLLLGAAALAAGFGRPSPAGASPGAVMLGPSADLQAAIDSLPAQGGTIYLSAGIYHLSRTLYTPCDRPVHLVGEGRDLYPLYDTTGAHVVTGTALIWRNATEGMIALRGNGSSIENLTLGGIFGRRAAAENLGYGIRIGRRNRRNPHPAPGQDPALTEYQSTRDTVQETVGKYFTIRNVTVQDTPGWGLYIPGYGAPAWGGKREADANYGCLSIFVRIEDTDVKRWGGYGGIFVGAGNTTVALDHVLFERHRFVGEPAQKSFYAFARGAAACTWTNVVFEGANPDSVPWVELVGCDNFLLRDCYFEADGSDDSTFTYRPTWFFALAGQCHGIALENPVFGRAGGHGGVMKLVAVDSLTGVRGFTLANPMASSSPGGANGGGQLARARDALHDRSGNWRDPAMIDLGGAASSDPQNSILVLGRGKIRDWAAVRTESASVFDLPYRDAGVGLGTTMLGGLPGLRLPTIGDGDLKAAPENGNLRLDNQLGAGTSAGALRWSYAGRWRLSNNATSMTRSQRNAITSWSRGDLIIVHDRVDSLQVFVEPDTCWKSITSVP